MALTSYYLSAYAMNEMQFYLTFGVLRGIGVGMCYLIPLICGWEYFPDKKGTVSGIILSGYGFSSFIFAHVSTALVNPDHLNPTIADPETGVTYFDAEVASRVPFMTKTLVAIWALITVFSITLISKPDKIPEEEVSDATTVGSDDEDILTTSEGDEYRQAPQSLPSQAPELKSIFHCVYSKPFRQLFFFMLLANFSPVFFSYTFKTYGLDKQVHPPISDMTLTWAASIGAGGVNGLSKLTFGWLMDRVSFKTLFTIILSIGIVNGCVSYWAAWYPSLYFLCIMLNYVVIGGIYACFPTCV